MFQADVEWVGAETPCGRGRTPARPLLGAGAETSPASCGLGPQASASAWKRRCCSLLTGMFFWFRWCVWFTTSKEGCCCLRNLQLSSSPTRPCSAWLALMAPWRNISAPRSVMGHVTAGRGLDSLGLPPQALFTFLDEQELSPAGPTVQPVAAIGGGGWGHTSLHQPPLLPSTDLTPHTADWSNRLCLNQKLQPLRP